MVAGITDLGAVNGFDIRMVENAAGLSRLEQTALVEELNSISVDAFNKATPLEETWERTIGVDVIYLIEDSGRIVGYTTNDFMNLAGFEVNYFSSALFRREVQNRGLYRHINRLRMETHPRKVIMTRTQNPMVAQGFKDVCREKSFSFFPNGGSVSQEVMSIARAYASGVNQHMICERVYGRALMDDTPVPAGEVAPLFTNLNIARGDGIILVGTK